MDWFGINYSKDIVNTIWKPIDSLEDDRVRLQLKIDELTNGVRLDGLDVVVTMYHPVRHQTDGTPNILANGWN